jgi:putative cardiolipin synthase
LSKCAPTSANGLNAKSSIFDRKIAVVGSFNFNLRSTYLNTKSLLVIESHSVAKSLANDIELAMNKDNSCRLNLVGGNIQWYSGDSSWDHEPKTEF